VGVGLGGHVVHAQLTIKIPLIDGVSHGLSDASLPPSGAHIGRRVIGKVVGRDCGRRRRWSSQLRSGCACSVTLNDVIYDNVPSLRIILRVAVVENYLRVVVVAIPFCYVDVGSGSRCRRRGRRGFGDVDESSQALLYGSNGNV
jgi:hypothetical protein